MDNSTKYTSEKYKKRSKSNKKSGWRIFFKILAFLLSIGLWCGIVYYGYNYAKDYVDTSIANVQQNNMMAIEDLKEEIKIVNLEIRNLRDEIEDLEDELEDTDSTLSSTNDIQEDLEERLKYLDDKLIKLQESLEILGEAPNVQN